MAINQQETTRVVVKGGSAGLCRWKNGAGCRLMPMNEGSHHVECEVREDQSNVRSFQEKRIESFPERRRIEVFESKEDWLRADGNEVNVGSFGKEKLCRDVNGIGG